MSKSLPQTISISDGKKTRTFSSITAAAKEYAISRCAITNALKKGNKSITRRADKKELFLVETKKEKSQLAQDFDLEPLPMDEEWFDRFQGITKTLDEVAKFIAAKLIVNSDASIDWKTKELLYNGERVSIFTILPIICRVLHYFNKAELMETIHVFSKIKKEYEAKTKHCVLVGRLKGCAELFQLELFNKMKKYK